MKLGIYRYNSERSDVYTRLALYDFDANQWHPQSEGRFVAKASAHPSPEELKVRFDLDPDARRTIVAIPKTMAASEYTIEVSTPEKSVAEGHKTRRERGGPMKTQTEWQAQRRDGYRVFPDDYELTEEGREFYESRGETVIHESDWDFCFEEQFDIEFMRPDDIDEKD